MMDTLNTLNTSDTLEILDTFDTLDRQLIEKLKHKHEKMKRKKLNHKTFLRESGESLGKLVIA